MALNQNIIQGKWREIKGEIQKLWGQLTDDELEKTKGDMKAIGGLIQTRYGEEQENYKTKLSQIFERFGDHKEDSVEKIKSAIKNHPM